MPWHINPAPGQEVATRHRPPHPSRGMVTHFSLLTSYFSPRTLGAGGRCQSNIGPVLNRGRPEGTDKLQRSCEPPRLMPPRQQARRRGAFVRHSTQAGRTASGHGEVLADRHASGHVAVHRRAHGHLVANGGLAGVRGCDDPPVCPRPAIGQAGGLGFGRGLLPGRVDQHGADGYDGQARGRPRTGQP